MPIQDLMADKSNFTVFFSAAWYPNRYDTMFGLFVQKHARAVATQAEVGVIYPFADDRIEKWESELIDNNGVLEARVYYPQKKKGLPLLSSFLKMWKYRKAWRIGYRLLENKMGHPDAFHINVLTRAGVPVYYKSRKLNIPYIITEHWTRYLPQGFGFHGRIRKWITRKIVRRANAVCPVSRDLEKAMKGHNLLNDNYCVVPNVVETDMFVPVTKDKEAKIREIVHISCFEDHHKNVSGLLEGARLLREKRQDFVLHLIGDGMDFEEIRKGAAEQEKEGYVIFEGIKTGNELAALLARADFSVLFSNYENMPVVINESFSCGVPVLSTDVGGISEMLKEKFGVLIPAKDTQALAREMNRMLDEADKYDAEFLRNFAVNSFSYEKVGESFLSLYKS